MSGDMLASFRSIIRDGRRFRAKYFLLNTDFAAKRHIPDWEGLDRFRWTLVHPSYWPKEEPDLKGKRVAVIGTGSTAIQLSSFRELQTWLYP